jgi:hypothetical protein
MQKHKFGVTCPSALFINSVLVPAEREEECVDILRRGCTGMHYVTRRSYRIQKYKFSVKCSNKLFMETAPAHPKHYK